MVQAQWVAAACTATQQHTCQLPLQGHIPQGSKVAKLLRVEGWGFALHRQQGRWQGLD